MKGRLQKLIDACGFKSIADITVDAFTTWRSRQEGVGPKTLNHYLSGTNAFLNWLNAQVALKCPYGDDPRQQREGCAVLASLGSRL